MNLLYINISVSTIRKLVHKWLKIFAMNLYHACLKAIVFEWDVGVLAGIFKLVFKWTISKNEVINIKLVRDLLSRVIFVLCTHNS